MSTTIRLAAIAAALAASACGRAHLTPTFGTSNRAAFEAQRVRGPDDPAPRPNMALDAQETGVVADSYVRSLAGKGAKAEAEPVLYVAPQQGGQPQRLAPSVPRD